MRSVCTMSASVTEAPPANCESSQSLYVDDVCPVSYTHLDVYKRQGNKDSPVSAVKTNPNTISTAKTTKATIAAANKSVFFFKTFISLSLFQGKRPVSYTHLDVYKRQEGNGVALHLFTSADLATDNRSMVNISTFGKRDIVNTDSMYGNTHGDGITDIGWAYACLLYTSRCV